MIWLGSPGIKLSTNCIRTKVMAPTNHHRRIFQELLGRDPNLVDGDAFDGSDVDELDDDAKLISGGVDPDEPGPENGFGLRVLCQDDGRSLIEAGRAQGLSDQRNKRQAGSDFQKPNNIKEGLTKPLLIFSVLLKGLN